MDIQTFPNDYDVYTSHYDLIEENFDLSDMIVVLMTYSSFYFP